MWNIGFSAIIIVNINIKYLEIKVSKNMSNLYYEENNKLVVEPNCVHIMLVKTDAKNNNNKFYELTLNNDVVTAKYGRVGATGTTTNVGRGFSAMERKAREKYNKGYLPVVLSDVNVENSDNINKQSMLDCALSDIIPKSTTKNDKDILTQLISMLVRTNQHEIMKFSGGQIQVDDSGLVKTAVGVVSLQNIQEAKKILVELSKLKHTDNDFIPLLNKYLMLIPQKVSHSYGWHETFFKNQDSFQKQNDFLEQLENSVKNYEDMIKIAKQEKEKSESKSKKKTEKVFHTHLKLVKDKAIIEHISSFFNDNKNSSHQSSNLKLKNVYEICNLYDKKFLNNFEKLTEEKGNVHEYWHGSRNYNLLSILKNGLIIPKANAFNVTGRMFGDGVYFSSQSTKSLNYSQGYWDRNNHSIDNNCFMFLADVIMGKVFEASHKQAKEDYENGKLGNKRSGIYPIKGYDSVIARGGVKNVIHYGGISHLQNDEMIVFNLEQIKLKYLCEFEPM